MLFIPVTLGEVEADFRCRASSPTYRNAPAHPVRARGFGTGQGGSFEAPYLLSLKRFDGIGARGLQNCPPSLPPLCPPFSCAFQPLRGAGPGVPRDGPKRGSITGRVRNRVAGRGAAAVEGRRGRPAWDECERVGGCR